MSYVIKAVLSNARHPEYGQATIPFPVSNEEYGDTIALLSPLGIGDAVCQDCQIDDLDSFYTVLNRMLGTSVTFDELDYLAKRLDSFDDGEAAQFQGMAHKLGLSNIKDLINLTFCCQQATVITDFSDLWKIGQEHYMNLNGGCASVQELENLDGYETALQLIGSGAGTVTPYGVIYDNGMKLEQLYDGRHLPGYYYNEDMLAVGITSRDEPENTPKITWLYLPCSRLQIERGMQRSGIANPEDMRFWYEDSALPKEVEDVLELHQESIYNLNELAAAVKKLSMEDRKKLGAATAMAKPEYAFQIRHLAENLDQFEFAPNVQTPAEYGRYMIQESGHFDYDPNLTEFYDYEKYGCQRMEQQSGMFTDSGYISYHGTLSLEELMMEDPAEQYQQEQGPQLGGLT